MKRARAPESTGDKLRDLLRQQTQAATDEALRSGGEVPAEKLESLTSLARLIELRQAAQPQAKRRRWPVILVLAGTLLIVSVLFFARLSETEVELDLTLNELGFTLSRQQVLTDSMNLSALGISGMDEVQLPVAAKPEDETLRESDGTMSSLHLSSTLAGKRQGSISLATLAFPSETRVWVRQTGVPHQYRLSLKGPSLKLQADVNGPLQVALAGRGIEQRDFQTPRAVHMQAGADEVDLDLTLPETARGALSSQLSASDLSLLHVDEFQNSDQTLVRQLSTILSGTIYFSALNDQQRQLRPGETIRFEKSDGEFRTIRMQDDHIDVKFHGRVRGLTIGAGENRRSLMPTWLDWLRARHGLSLLWGSAFYLFGLIVGVLRWWGKTVMKFTNRIWNLILVLVACVSLLLSFPALARAQDAEPETDTHFDKEFKQTSQLVVMVRLPSIEQFGAGIIFGREKDRLLIATAYHVLHKFADHPPVTVELKNMPGKLLNATLLKYDADKDVAVLSVEKQGINVCALPFDRWSDSANLKRKDEVMAIGNPNGVSWAMQVEPDKISEITPNAIVFQSNSISVGHSGGALIDKGAALVGMILADQPPFGRAINMGAVLQLVRQWGYPVLLQSALEKGRTLLHEAAKKGDLAAIKHLLAVCGDANAKDNEGAVPLHWAAWSGSADATLLLLKTGTDVNVLDGEGNTPLHRAALVEETETVRFLINSGAKVRVRNTAGSTPLHYAIGGSAELIKMLVTAGADVNALNNNKLTPMNLAIEKRPNKNHGKNETPWWLEVTQILIGAGAKIEPDALLDPVRFREVENLRVLLKAVSDLNGRTPLTGLTLLHGAVIEGSPEIVELLLKAGADVNAPGYRETPLLLAFQQRQTAIQDLLIARGGVLTRDGDKRLTWSDTNSWIFAAVQARRLVALKALLAAGADPSRNMTSSGSGEQPWTLLHLAMENEDVEIVRALVKAGADLNVIRDGETLLQRARRKGLTAIEKVLLEADRVPGRPGSQPSAPKTTSTGFRNYTNRDLFQLTIPDDWREFPSDNYSVTFAPEGGRLESQNGADVIRGIMIGAIATQSRELPQASADYVRTTLESNSHLRQQNPYQRIQIGGHNGLSTNLAGKSNTTGKIENVTIYTALLPNGNLFYLITISPQDEYSNYQRTFQTILRSVHINN